MSHQAVNLLVGFGDQTFPLPPSAIRTHRQCRASELSFQGLGGQGSKAVQPKDGDRYSIERELDQPS